MSVRTFADGRAWKNHHQRRSRKHSEEEGPPPPPPQARSHVEPMPMLPEAPASTSRYPPNSQAG